LAKRSIADDEIALIKAMVARNMKNKDIQFFFNRPDRPVNTGRISTIGNGSYSNSAKIPAASDADLHSFISAFSSTPGGTIVANSGAPSKRPFSHLIRALFAQHSEGDWYLKGGESEEHECKHDFDPKKLTSAIRAIAALANNKGGYLFFGVSNQGYRVEGVGAAFADTDVVRIVEKVKAHLSPTPSITAKGVIDFEGKGVGFVYVEKHPDRPVIVYRDGDGLNEGEILFRYAGQSSRIKFGDLRAMLEERDRRAQVALASAARKLADVGTANALILDLEKNVIDAQGRSILIDRELAESIKFIKEGEFDEKIGAPTLKLIGEVSAVTVNAPAIGPVSREALFQEQILEEFLTQAKNEHPIQYIHAGLAQSRQWLPIFYFARMTGKSNAQIAEALKSMKISQKGKKKILLDRLEGKKSALTKVVTKSARLIAAEISKGVLPIPATVEEVAPFANAMTAVGKTKVSLEDILSALRICRDFADKADDGNALGAVFKAACRVDEMFFGSAG
jgi:hypothetical protein